MARTLDSLRLPGLPALALLLVTGCSVVARDPHVEGGMRLKEYVTDPNGVVTDSVFLDAASGVPVWLAADSAHFTFAGTHHGYFSVGAMPGDYLLLAGPTIWCADTLGPVHLAHGTLALDSLVVLGDAGRLTVAANTPGAASRAIHFQLATPGRALLAIRALDGTIRRVLADRSWAAGTYQLNWNGADDAGAALPAGDYWVTLEKFAVGSDRPAAHPNDIPIGGGAPGGSPRRGERALLRWP